jgi:TPR repeat protein
VKWFRKAADQGDAYAQGRLGSRYYNGKGVPQSYAEAAKWYRKSADQGDFHSQGILGEMYVLGQGVPQDYVQAHKWLNLAAAAGVDEALCNQDAKERDVISLRMTPAQIAEAQKLAREWKPTKQQSQ